MRSSSIALFAASALAQTQYGENHVNVNLDSQLVEQTAFPAPDVTLLSPAFLPNASFDPGWTALSGPRTTPSPKLPLPTLASPCRMASGVASSQRPTWRLLRLQPLHTRSRTPRHLSGSTAHRASTAKMAWSVLSTHRKSSRVLRTPALTDIV